MSERKHIARSASVMSLATLISRILGFVRDMVIAGFFGATGVSDVFFAAFKIPNLFRELLAEGSMSSAFIPVLSEYNVRHGKEEANRLVKIVFTFIFIFVGLLCLIGMLFPQLFVSFIAVGFLVKHPDKFDQTIQLTRVMFPFLFMVSLAALVMGSLNTRRSFFIPALSSAWFNVAVIATIFVLYSKMAQPIIAVAIGVTVGGFFQFVTQLPSFYRKGFRLNFDLSFKHPGLKQIGILIVPASLGMGVNQLNVVINNNFASFLPSGSITYLYFAMRLIQFPIGIFGVAMSMATLASFSRHASKGDIQSLRNDFSFSLRLLFFITLPSMIGLIALREPIINLLFQRGEFDYHDTQQTAFALIFYSLGIWSITGGKTVTSAFYSLKDTKTPFKIVIVALIVNILFSYILMHPLKHGGIALANTISSAVNFLLLLFFLRKKIMRIDARKIASSFIKALSAAAVMGLAGNYLLQGDLWKESGNGLIKSVYLLGTVALCLAIYFACSYILKNSELGYVADMLRKKRKHAA